MKRASSLWRSGGLYEAPRGKKGKQERHTSFYLTEIIALLKAVGI
jgi:hypothetical protein